VYRDRERRGPRRPEDLVWIDSPCRLRVLTGQRRGVLFSGAV
jgi:hypothetical protein